MCPVPCDFRTRGFVFPIYNALGAWTNGGFFAGKANGEGEEGLSSGGGRIDELESNIKQCTMSDIISVWAHSKEIMVLDILKLGLILRAFK